MPTGVGQFLAYRITVKNFLLGGIFLLVTVLSFRAFGLSARSRGTSFWKELVQIVKACAVASFFALVFPLTNVSGAFHRPYGRAVLTSRNRSVPLRAHRVFCADRASCKAFRKRRDLIIVGSGPRAAELYRQVCQPELGYTRILGFVDSPNGHWCPM